MASAGLGRYDHPNFIIRREAHKNTVAGNAAIMYFRHFQKMRLRGVHFTPIAAGTSAGHTLVVKHGTSALGTATLGTSAQGAAITSLQGLNEVCAALDQLSVTNGTDATGTAEVIFEFEVLPDAVLSV